MLKLYEFVKIHWIKGSPYIQQENDLVPHPQKPIQFYLNRRYKRSVKSPFKILSESLPGCINFSPFAIFACRKLSHYCKL